MSTRGSRIFPVLLSGGTGARLWPASRESHPKQLLPLTEDLTLLQSAAARVSDPARFEPLIVVANAEHRFTIAEQLRIIGAKDPLIALEPCGRNTAAPTAVAALLARDLDPAALILVMPADHVVRDTAKFLASVDQAAAIAARGALVLFGVDPTSPIPDYGYIRPGAALETDAGAYRVEHFVEKPSPAVAEAMVKGGGHLWNSGLLLAPAQLVIDELERHEPAVLLAAKRSLAEARRDLDFVRLDEAAFQAGPSISLDHALTERTDRLAVIKAEFDWTDVGAWSALWALGEKTSAGNVLIGEAFAEATTNSYVRSEGPLVATLGVRDLIVVATPDAVLVADRGSEQDVGRIVELLRAAGREPATQARQVRRPWGWYESVVSGAGFQVKRITVAPGCKLSLQSHAHRAEHWVVVSGVAVATIGDEEVVVRANESVFIPQGARHRLANPGDQPLSVIEVQSGDYLGEDDIVRFEDDYARN
ncbi:MAG: mannose-1-phosphate guanylyltransferase/mannose-6-phosphate isomerase [Phenylobacterium sp.]|uniref:mannose-1-phosphate guanylyltransferase/mannose-6-phosphate isomerase n=1 Tax=Phenylobacterium sp. TaxID=1871053 RepID=UPI002721EE55|nr:mannose-1-phosphate guanylyltransferase/mannose-6-phosphate isomerase [Phenylobacterium sp.]MDO9432368.1 mannose-1-phosphate guanylyltransferase/mannose-6-phosphate isomerase [Phenylobacterium sp.]